MSTQNIILVLSKETIMKVKQIAAQRRMTVSDLLTIELEALIAREETFSRAMQHHLSILEDKAIDLGTRGQILTPRDELHER